MTDKEQIWRRIAEMETPGFFITADIMCEGSSELDGLEVFIKGKITQIQQGITGRKFTFQEGEWRLHLTFFPTNCATSAGVAKTFSVPLPMVLAVFSGVTATLCLPRIPVSNI